MGDKMLYNQIITETNDIFNFIKELKINLHLTRIQRIYLVLFIKCLSISGSCVNLINISKMYFVKKHKTSIGRFLSDSNWKVDKIIGLYQKFIRKIIWGLALNKGEAIKVIIDDTILEKTKPSSKAKKPSEKCAYHYSHTKGKQVYGYQVVVVLLKCGKVKLPYMIKFYDKSKMSKIEMAEDLILSLPKPIYAGYILSDSWYSSEKIIKSSKKAGYTYIGAIKTNRVVYPKDFRMGVSISFLAKKLDKSKFDLVTVKKKNYYIYSYTGKINGFMKVTIVICYPEKQFGKEKALKSFISTNNALEANKILDIYSERWSIEVFIRTNKMVFGLKNFRVRSYRSFEKLLLIQMITYFYVASKDSDYNFLKSLREIRNNANRNLIRYVYFLAKEENKQLDEIENIILKKAV